MSFTAVQENIVLIADLFMGAATAGGAATEPERRYAREQLEDLLGQRPLPDALLRHLELFDRSAFDMALVAAQLKERPPMRLRRLLELCAFVTLADGELTEPEDEYIRELGAAFGLQESQYRDLTLAHESRGPRRTFTQMAVVTLPGPGEKH